MLIDPEIARFIKKLKQSTGISVPIMDKLRTDTSGMQLEGTNIIGLSLDKPYLRTFPRDLTDLKSLKKLYIHRNQFIKLPESFGNLQSLQILYLARSKLDSRNKYGLRTLPESFGQLKSLQLLDLSRNKIVTLPNSFGQLKALQNLFLGRNRLKRLPESFGGLKSLRFLDVQWNQLSTLPESFENLGSLQGLHLSDNLIKTLPESILKLPSLKMLHLDGNQLTTLPESFCALKSLEHLDLGYNQLTALPESFWQLENLKRLNLFGNPWKEEWKEIVTYSVPGVLDACRKRARITLFICHAPEDRETYRIDDLKNNLTNRKNSEILKVYTSGDKNIPNFQLILLLATKKLLNSSEVLQELGKYLSQDKEIVPIKGRDIDWDDLKQIDLRKEGSGVLNLKSERGVAYDDSNLEGFYKELYLYIYQYKRLHNVFDPKKEKVDNIKRSNANIIGRFIKSERFSEFLMKNQRVFEEICSKYESGNLTIHEFLNHCNQILSNVKIQEVNQKNE